MSDILLTALIVIYFASIFFVLGCALFVPRQKRKKLRPKENGYYEWGNYEEREMSDAKFTPGPWSAKKNMRILQKARGEE